MEVITIKKSREKTVLHRHPWIFSGALQKVPTKVKSGDIVQVVDYQSNLLGYGFFSRESQIAIRFFEFTHLALQIDENYWFKKWQKIWNFKLNLLEPDTNAFRFIHAEGDQMPGLIVDIYNQTAVIQAMTVGTYHLLPLLQKFLFSCNILYHFDKSDARILEKEGINPRKEWLTEKTNDLWFQENGIWFWCDVEEGQKTGFFLDQKNNRDLVGNLSKNKMIANVFAYSGGFSLYALKNQAKKVYSVDSSQRAIQVLEKNLQKNGLTSENHVSVVADAFDWLKQMPENEMDIIILDPPAFAKHQSAVGQAYRGYKEINLQALKKIKSGGYLFTFSCSQVIGNELFRKILFDAATDAQRHVRILQFLGHSYDHAPSLFHLEGDYLKGYWLYVE
jgi:23S rRNA (cytosine1962-C5)-methyltransferase